MTEEQRRIEEEQQRIEAEKLQMRNRQERILLLAASYYTTKVIGTTAFDWTTVHFLLLLTGL